MGSISFTGNVLDKNTGAELFTTSAQRNITAVSGYGSEVPVSFDLNLTETYSGTLDTAQDYQVQTIAMVETGVSYEGCGDITAAMYFGASNPVSLVNYGAIFT